MIITGIRSTVSSLQVSRTTDGQSLPDRLYNEHKTAGTEPTNKHPTWILLDITAQNIQQTAAPSFQTTHDYLQPLLQLISALLTHAEQLLICLPRKKIKNKI